MGYSTENFGGYTAKTCLHRLGNEHGGRYKDVELLPVPDDLQKRFEEGIAFEAEVVSYLDGKHGSESWYRSVKGDAHYGPEAHQREQDTIAAMNNPDVLFITNPRLPAANGKSGEPDFLIRTECGWAAADAKNHKVLDRGKTVFRDQMRYGSLDSPMFGDTLLLESPGKPNQNDALQLAHYRRQLEANGYQASNWGAILGNDRQFIWVDLDSKFNRGGRGLTVQEQYEENWRKAMQVIQADRSVHDGTGTLEDRLKLASPVKITECPNCPWREICAEDREALQEPTLLTSVTPQNRDALVDNGLTTVGSLLQLDSGMLSAHADKKTLRQCKSLAAGDGDADLTLEVISRPYTRSLAKAQDEVLVYQSGRVSARRGVGEYSLPRADLEVDFDFEDSDGRLYMVGMWVSWHGSGESPLPTGYRYSFELDPDPDVAETKCFSWFWEQITEVIPQAAESVGASYAMYYYSPHEMTVSRAVVDRLPFLNLTPSMVRKVFAAPEMIDMYPLLRTNTIWPTMDYSIKKLGPAVGHHWRDSGVNGGVSLQLYEAAVGGDGDAHDTLLRYNEDDVLATFRIRQYLTDNPAQPVEDLRF